MFIGERQMSPTTRRRNKIQNDVVPDAGGVKTIGGRGFSGPGAGLILTGGGNGCTGDRPRVEARGTYNCGGALAAGTEGTGSNVFTFGLRRRGSRTGILTSEDGIGSTFGKSSSRDIGKDSEPGVTPRSS